MAAVRTEPRPRAHAGAWRWLLDSRPLSLSPVAATAIAAGLIGIGVLFGAAGSRLDRGGLTGATGHAPRVAEPKPPSSDSVRVIKFVLVAPHASTVSLVGDFNEWDANATPMTRTPTGGTWSVAVRLPPG